MKLLDLVVVHTTEKNLLSNASIKKYSAVVKTFISDTGVDSIEISHDDILGWRKSILARSSAGNWNNYHRHMRAILQTAVEFKYLDENPFKKVKSIAHYPNKQHVLSVKQINYLLELCSNNVISLGWFWAGVIQTLRYTGIRRRQLIGLTWGDFNVERKELRLQTHTSKTKREYTIPMNQQVVDSILLIKQKTTCLDLDDQEQIFNITKISPRYKAKNMNEEHLARFFVKTSKIVNFAISAHRFRRTLATRLANNGKTNIKTVQNLLGHSSVHTTLGYVHPSMDDMRDAVELL